MAQRLTFKVELLKDIAKTFGAMYVEDKLYEYSNYIQIGHRDNKLCFEMCIIMDGASNDSLVRLYGGECEPFEPISVGFAHFKTVVESLTGEEVILEVDEKSLKYIGNKSVHRAEVSSVKIPNLILNTMNRFMENNSTLLVDFNLLNLYNKMKDVGENLTMNTLRADLYGVYATDDAVIATNGYSIAVARGKFVSTPFLFPKHSIKILQLLPKIGAKYAIVDNKIYIVGVGFECYIGEWSGFKTYPTKTLAIFEKPMAELVDGSEAFAAIRSMHKFDDVAIIYPGKGYVETKDGKHRVEITPTPEFGEWSMIIHSNILAGVNQCKTLKLSMETPMALATLEGKNFLFLGMRKLDE